MDLVSTADLYEASFYLLSGCMLEAIRCEKRAGKFESSFLFSSPELPRLQREYLSAAAAVNLYAFRRAYGQVQSYALDARRKAEVQSKRQEVRP